MHIISARNVNEAYHAGLSYLLAAGREEATRAGPCLVASGPVTTIYARPCERILFAPKRDANPFFHIAEALWMLAGRNDAALLNRYVRDFGARFAEPDGTIHGAYGHRWRAALGYDQLAFIIDKFRKDPGTRQCVLSMWDGPGEPIDSGSINWTCGDNDLRGDWRDRPCNTHIYFRLRNEIEVVGMSYGHGIGGASQAQMAYLDMMVCCRSNDIIFGAYGANVVHLSILQEYMAAMVGAQVGVYHQVSFNFHAYLDALAKVGKPELDDRYASDGLLPMPLVDHPESFDSEVHRLLKMVDEDSWGGVQPFWRNDFLGGTAMPLLRAHSRWRAGAREQALDGLEEVMAPDWRAAAQEWMARRLKRGAA